jgi:hypothetical protein
MSKLGIFRKLLKKFTDWDRFQSLALELILPKILINLDADKAARDFTAYVTSAYRLATIKVTLLEINSDIV